jgi:hypothetical protein
MKLGDTVWTPSGKGILGESHRMRKGEKDHFLNDISYLMYAVRLKENNTVRYFLPDEIKSIKIELVEDRLTGTVYEMEVLDE